MTSGPEPDWIDAVVRAWISLALIVSNLSVMPSAFWHSGTISLRITSSEAGTKSTQRSQWTVVACANAGARPVARMAAIPPVFAATAPPPESFRKLRRLKRAMAFLPKVSVAEITRMRGWSNTSRSERILPGQTKWAPPRPGDAWTGPAGPRRRMGPYDDGLRPSPSEPPVAGVADHGAV